MAAGSGSGLLLSRKNPPSCRKIFVKSPPTSSSCMQHGIAALACLPSMIWSTKSAPSRMTALTRQRPLTAPKSCNACGLDMTCLIALISSMIALTIIVTFLGTYSNLAIGPGLHISQIVILHPATFKIFKRKILPWWMMPHGHHLPPIYRLQHRRRSCQVRNTASTLYSDLLRPVEPKFQEGLSTTLGLQQGCLLSIESR